jgi:hypothetical protein
MPPTIIYQLATVPPTGETDLVGACRPLPLTIIHQLPTMPPTGETDLVEACRPCHQRLSTNLATVPPTGETDLVEACRPLPLTIIHQLPTVPPTGGTDPVDVRCSAKFRAISDPPPGWPIKEKPRGVANCQKRAIGVLNGGPPSPPKTLGGWKLLYHEPNPKGKIPFLLLLTPDNPKTKPKEEGIHDFAGNPGMAGPLYGSQH